MRVSFQKVLNRVMNGVSILMIAAAALILLNVVLTKPGEVPDVGGYSILRVITGSMEPELHTNSIILVHKVSPETVREGDVISFYSRDPSLLGAVNTHRVLGITRENGTLYYQTKGDANYIPDAYPANENDLIGVVVGSSYIFGVLVRLLSNPLIFFPVILVPLVILLVVNLRNAYLSAKEIARQEEKAAIAEALDEARKMRQAREEQAEQDADGES